MFRQLYTLTAILPILLLSPLAAEYTRDYLNLPLRPFNSAIAGQTGHSMPSQAAALVNPAFLGYGDQNTFFGGTLQGSGIQGYFAEGALFSPFGGLTFAAEYLKAQDQAFAMSFGYGSFLSRRVATGLSLTPRYVYSDTAQAFGFGIDPSLLFDSKWQTSIGENDGVGIYSPSVFVRTQNLAIPVGDTEMLVKPSVHVGVLSGLYHSGHFNLALIASTYGTDQYDKLPLNAGVQTQYRFILFSLGYGFGNYNPTGNGVSLGLGASIPLSFGDTFLFYSWSAGNSQRADLHSFSAGVRLGGIDSDPPEISFESEGSAFSPNNDGVRDVMAFSAQITDKSPIVYYEFRVRDATGNIVYKQNKDDRIREKDFSWTLFFRSFVAPRNRSDIPARFFWNGRMSVEKKKPVKDEIFQDSEPDQALPDGVYRYEFWAVDEKNNESRHATGEIRLDTRSPAAAVELSDDLISPNGDGQRDMLTVTQDTSAGDSYQAQILNARGEKVRSWRWAENAPTRVDFDGLKDDGTPADEGSYLYKLTGNDAAGNQIAATSGSFFISRRIDGVLLRSSAAGFNPSAKQFSEMQLTPTVMYDQGYLDGEILINRRCPAKPEDLIFRIAVTAPPVQPKGAKKAKPAVFTWRGEAMGQTRAPDGIYCAVFKARFENGNQPESVPLSITLDTSAPEIEISADLDLRQFTPDNDGENEEQAFRLYAKDLSGIKTYQLTISEVLPDAKLAASLVPVRRFQGKGDLPQTIYWDGKTDTGLPVESLTLYEYSVQVTDIYGNSTTTPARRFETGVLALKSGTGYLVRLPNAMLDDPLNERLEYVSRLLGRYSKYKIKIEAHAVAQSGIERTLRQTEAAARKVYDYLLDKGIAAERLSYQGFGDSTPAYNGRGPQAAKNSRIDFLLSR